jgi:signal transduction histidine kinase
MYTQTRTPIDEAAPASERRLDRASWAILGISAVLLLCSIAQLAYRLTLPTDGWSYHSGDIGSDTQYAIIYDANLLGQPSPLLPGDVVLAVEGHAFDELLDNALNVQPPLITDWRAKITARYQVQRERAALELQVPLRRWYWQEVAWRAVSSTQLPFRLADAAIGLFVFLRRPRDLAARLLLLLAVVWLTFEISNIVAWGLPEMMHPPLFLVALLFSNWIYGSLAAPTLLLLALSFPQPKPFVRRRTLPLIAAVYGTLPLLLVLFGPQPFLGWGWTATCGLLSLFSVVHTLLTVSDPLSRAQLRWAGLGVFGIALSVLLGSTSGFGRYPPVLEQLFAALGPLLQLAFPVTLAIAILRYRLFDINIILSRALVYGTLTVCVVGCYIGIVAYLGALVQSEDNLLPSLIATGIIAVAFQPLRAWLQQVVNRLLFGQRDEPYHVIATLGQQLETPRAPRDLFAAIVETIGQSLKLPFVAIMTNDEPQPRAVFQQPSGEQHGPPTPLERLPLNYHNQALGTLLVAPRIGEARFKEAEQKLLHDLARQIGIAVYATQMTAAVQRSRERIIVAREEERRRLRRDLHDGLGPHLASQTLTLDVIARLMRADPEQAAALLLAVRTQMQQAVSDIRDLIYGLRPPVLDDLGLNGALKEFADRGQQQPSAPQVILHLPPLDTPLPAAVEVAAYRIFQEALTNVVRHAQARHCEVRLEIHNVVSQTGEANVAAQAPRLLLDVSDDGIGIAADRLSGVGLQSMRERCEELGGQLVIVARDGGGTRICALLPVAAVGQTDELDDPDR